MAMTMDETAGKNINLGDNYSFERTDAFSAGCWVVRPNIDNACALIGKYENTVGRGWLLNSNTFAVAEYFRFVLTYNDGGNRLIVDTPANFPASTTWYHVFFTYTGSSLASGVKIYVDGVNQTLTVESDALSATTINNGKARIGARGESGNITSILIGSIEDVRIYNRVLSTDEVMSIYIARGADNIVEGLVGRWLLNEGAPGVVASGADSCRDISISGIHGTPAVSPVYAASRLKIKRPMIVTV